MEDYDKIYKKLKEQYTEEEIAEGYMIPAQLSEKELEKSNKELLKARMERMAKRSEKQRLIAELARLRVRVKKYLQSDLFLDEFSFGKILSEYIQILSISQQTFARDIGIHPSMLSRLLHDKENPNIRLTYRLETHSDGIIPAVLWWKLISRKQAYLIEQNEAQRKKEGKKVQNPLDLSLEQES